MSSIDLAWLRPRAVVMNNAHPPFSITIGARQAHADGLLSAHSENVMPAGELPTAASYRSEPTTCQVEPFLKRINISDSLVLTRRSYGYASSMLRLPVCGLTAFEGGVRAGTRRRTGGR